MWDRIKETVSRAISGIVYGIWGSVGFRTDYNENTKEVSLVVWDKSYKCSDKKAVVDMKFKFDLENIPELKAKYDVIASIEKYLLENYS